MKRSKSTNACRAVAIDKQSTINNDKGICGHSQGSGGHSHSNCFMRQGRNPKEEVEELKILIRKLKKDGFEKDC